METEKALGVILKELRKQKGISQEALAHAADLERNFISLVENGRNSVSIKTMFKISAALGVSVSQIVELVERRLGS